MRSDTISWRVNAERLVLLGWSRAILLQLAHPLIAAGVADHSSFRGGGIAAARRLHLTVRAMLALTFGDARERTAALEGILAIHRRVNGYLAVAAGRFPAGTAYSAEDADLVLWVHATLLESIPMIYDRVVRPLTPAERDAYCDEAAPIALELGARADEIPRSWDGLDAYLKGMRESGSIAVSAQARELASAVLAPAFAPLVAPAAWLNRLVTVGLLPPHIREQYGFEWTTANDRTLARVAATIRATRRVTPAAIAWWPAAFSAPRSQPDTPAR